MSDGGFKKKYDTLTPALQKLLSRAQSTNAALARVYPIYQDAQIQRFETEGQSEGSPWPALNPTYKAYKPRRYGGGIRHKWVGGRGIDGYDKEGNPRPWAENGTWQSFPGGGRRMMIGTSTLAGAIIGPGSNTFSVYGTEKHRATFTSSRMTIRVAETGNNAEGHAFDYPHMVAEKRPFFRFGGGTRNRMLDAIRRFVVGQ